MDLTQCVPLLQEAQPWKLQCQKRSVSEAAQLQREAGLDHAPSATLLQLLERSSSISSSTLHRRTEQHFAVSGRMVLDMATANTLRGLVAASNSRQHVVAVGCQATSSQGLGSQHVGCWHFRFLWVSGVVSSALSGSDRCAVDWSCQFGGSMQDSGL
jgi:hypothetical protein